MALWSETSVMEVPEDPSESETRIERVHAPPHALIHEIYS